MWWIWWVCWFFSRAGAGWGMVVILEHANRISRPGLSPIRPAGLLLPNFWSALPYTTWNSSNRIPAVTRRLFWLCFLLYLRQSVIPAHHGILRAILLISRHPPNPSTHRTASPPTPTYIRLLHTYLTLIVPLSTEDHLQLAVLFCARPPSSPA